MFFRRRNYFKYIFKVKYLLVFSIIILMYNEFFVYYLQSIHWSKIRCQTDNCIKILFVADPQIIGETYDKNFYNGLAIIDSDRYLHHGYKQAFQHVQPDLIVFLGDLMDEGSVANNIEFQRYYERFKNIFNQDTNMIYLPGDNDIGGENSEPILKTTVTRFYKAFPNNNIIILNNNTEILIVNRLLHSIPKHDVRKYDNNRKRIVLSHLPILFTSGLFVQQVIEELDPHIMFSAHLHKSIKMQTTLNHINMAMASTVNMDKTNRYNIQMYNINNLKLKGEFVEIMIPTCSYRMGVYDIGYGMAVLDNNELKYTVLWTPNRFIQLAIYVIWLIFIFIICLSNCLRKYLIKCCAKKQYVGNSSYSQVDLMS